MEAYWTCSVCEKLFSDENAQTEIAEPVFHHTGEMIKEDELPAVCMQPGTKEHWYCSSCYKNFSDENGQHYLAELESIPEPGEHGTITEVPETPSTCTVAGEAAYWVCEDCHWQFSDAEGINQIFWADPLPLAPHSYADEMDLDGAEYGDIVGYACEECGKLDPDRQYTYFDDYALEEVEAGKYYVAISEENEGPQNIKKKTLNLVNGPYTVTISDVTGGTATISEVKLNGEGESLGQGNEFTYDATDHAGDSLEITLTVTGSSTFIISVEGEVSRALKEGENNVKITVDSDDDLFWDMNGAGWDVYTFASETPGIYTITVPKGVEVGIKNPNFDPDDFFSVPVDVILEYDFDDPDEVFAYFKVGSEPVELCFRCNQIPKGKYTVKIEFYAEGGEEPEPVGNVLNLDETCTLDPFDFPCTATIGEGIEEGEYVLTVDLAQSDMGVDVTVTVGDATYTLNMANNYTATITVKTDDVLTFTTSAYWEFDATLSAPQA